MQSELRIWISGKEVVENCGFVAAMHILFDVGAASSRPASVERSTTMKRRLALLGPPCVVVAVLLLTATLAPVFAAGSAAMKSPTATVVTSNVAMVNPGTYALPSAKSAVVQAANVVADVLGPAIECTSATGPSPQASATMVATTNKAKTSEGMVRLLVYTRVPASDTIRAEGTVPVARAHVTRGLALTSPPTVFADVGQPGTVTFAFYGQGMATFSENNGNRTSYTASASPTSAAAIQAVAGCNNVDSTRAFCTDTDTPRPTGIVVAQHNEVPFAACVG